MVATGEGAATTGQLRLQLLVLMLLLLQLARVLLRVLPVVHRKSVGLQRIGVLLRDVDLDGLVVLQHVAQNFSEYRQITSLRIAMVKQYYVDILVVRVQDIMVKHFS